MKTISRDGKIKGKVISVCENRRCGCESCTGKVYCIRWEDGKVTYNCSKSFTTNKNGDLKLV